VKSAGVVWGVRVSVGEREGEREKNKGGGGWGGGGWVWGCVGVCEVVCGVNSVLVCL